MGEFIFYKFFRGSQKIAGTSNPVITLNQRKICQIKISLAGSILWPNKKKSSKLRASSEII